MEHCGETTEFSPPLDLKIFVLTLQDSEDRQRHIISQFAKTNLTFEFVYGIDGKKLSPAELSNSYDDKKCKRYSKRSLTPGEIGCALGHHLIYWKIVSTGINRAVILEDDSLLKNDFNEVIELLSKMAVKGYIIKIDLHEDMRGLILPVHKIRLNGDYEIQNSTTVGYARGYYIDGKAARKMYTMTRKIFTVADSWDIFRKSIKLRILNKPVVGEREFTSTIWGDTSWRPSLENAVEIKKSSDRKSVV
jgi:glycosyl transferase family 25